jgi:hypothetical protein
MTFEKFILDHDVAGAIVLLEGKREVAAEDREYLVQLGRKLAQHTRHMVFRSGNAEGADLLFAEGVAEVDASRLEVIVPYAGHRKKFNKAQRTYALDTLALSPESAVVIETQKAYPRLIDQYLQGAKNRSAINAAYLLRDTLKAIGSSEIPAASFGVFYDDLAKPLSGGTGHTMKICRQHRIPLVDQRIWKKWLEE